MTGLIIIAGAVVLAAYTLIAVAAGIIIGAAIRQADDEEYPERKTDQ